MPSHFSHWRRKAGIAAAVVACLLAVGWLRSQFATDVFRLTTSEHHSNGIMSDTGLIAWSRFHHPHREFIFPDWPAWVSDASLRTASLREIMETGLMEWSCRFQSFGSGQVTNMDDSTFSLVVVPYWFLTFPMALIAYLLLSNSTSQHDQISSTDKSPPKSTG